MDRITSYQIKLEVTWNNGEQETLNASDVYSKEIEWFLDGVEQERHEEKE